MGQASAPCSSSARAQRRSRMSNAVGLSSAKIDSGMVASSNSLASWRGR